MKKWIRYKYKESCFSSALCTILEGLGIITKQPEFLGLETSAEDFITSHMNLPKHDNLYSSGDAFDNRNIYNGQKLCESIGLKTLLIKRPSFIEMVEHYRKGRGAILHRPGHYMAGIGTELNHKVNVHHDPNGTSSKCKNGGRFETLTIQEWQKVGFLHALVIWEAA